jgi:hypothetical protein
MIDWRVIGGIIADGYAKENERAFYLHAKRSNELMEQMHKTRKPAVSPTFSKTECPCCGSREFVRHHGVKICAYCRVEA